MGTHQGSVESKYRITTTNGNVLAQHWRVSGGCREGCKECCWRGLDSPISPAFQGVACATCQRCSWTLFYYRWAGESFSDARKVLQFDLDEASDSEGGEEPGFLGSFRDSALQRLKEDILGTVRMPAAAHGPCGWRCRCLCQLPCGASSCFGLACLSGGD